MSYGIFVVSISHMIFYFNYRSLGYEWGQIFHYIVRTADFALLLISAITLTITVASEAHRVLHFFRVAVAMAFAFSAPSSKISSSSEESIRL